MQDNTPDHLTPHDHSQNDPLWDLISRHNGGEEGLLDGIYTLIGPEIRRQLKKAFGNKLSNVDVEYVTTHTVTYVMQSDANLKETFGNKPSNADVRYEIHIVDREYEMHVIGSKENLDFNHGMTRMVLQYALSFARAVLRKRAGFNPNQLYFPGLEPTQLNLPGLDIHTEGDEVPSNSAAELVVEIAIPEGVSDEEIIAAIQRLSLSANDLHRSLGGHGLKIKRLDIEAEIPAEVPIG